MKVISKLPTWAQKNINNYLKNGDFGKQNTQQESISARQGQLNVDTFDGVFRDVVKTDESNRDHNPTPNEVTEQTDSGPYWNDVYSFFDKGEDASKMATVFTDDGSGKYDDPGYSPDITTVVYSQKGVNSYADVVVSREKGEVTMLTGTSLDLETMTGTRTDWRV